MTSLLSSAICSFERLAIFVRSFSEISDLIVQKSSTVIGACIEKRNMRSDIPATPASERTACNLPGVAKRKASGASRTGGDVGTYLSTIPATT